MQKPEYSEIIRVYHLIKPKKGTRRADAVSEYFKGTISGTYVKRCAVISKTASDEDILAIEFGGAKVTTIYNQLLDRAHEEIPEKVKKQIVEYRPAPIFGCGVCKYNPADCEECQLNTPFGNMSEVEELLRSNKPPTPGQLKRWCTTLTNMTEAWRNETIKDKPEVNIEYGPEAQGRILHLSDLHFGRDIFDQKSGDNIYNTTLGEERLSHSYHRTSTELGDTRNLMVAHTGDLITGEDIFPSQAHRIDIPVIDQIFRLAKLEVKLLREISQMVDNVFAAYCSGNHSRIHKNYFEESNFDAMLAMIVEMMFHNYQAEGLYDNVHVEYSRDQFGTFEFCNKRIVLQHIGAKATNYSYPKAKIGAWGYMDKPDLILCGHWHQPKIDQYIDFFQIQSGALCAGGYENYERQKGLKGPASQAYFDVVKGYPHFQNYNLITF